MVDVKNRPYSPLTYDPGGYSDVTYTPASYSAPAYEPPGPVMENLIGKINIKDASVGVVGLGYVGLPLAVAFAEAGFKTLGVDLNPSLVEAVNQGETHVTDIPSKRLAPLVASGKLKAFDSYDCLTDADCISICVPTPLTKSKEPDISYITGAIDRLMALLGPRKLVVLESTTYPGTTDELIAARIEAELGLQVGKDIFVAFSPERVDPGNAKWHTQNTPKVLGGVTEHCTRVAEALYSAALNKVHTVRSAKEAETVKLLENTFRAVNIGLVNEFMLMCDRMGIDIWRVIDAAATKPFGFMPFYPGPGIGGHCIPLDPLCMSWKAKAVDFYNRFIELATDINGNMPRFVVSKLVDMLNDQSRAVKGARVLLLGMAYKKNINDIRESPGLEVFRLLRHKGAEVDFSDPHVSSFVSLTGETVGSVSLEGNAVKAYHAVVLVTDHDAFPYRALVDSAAVILDCRNGFGNRGIESHKIIKL